MRSLHETKKGFSLVELAIVLVIIGLITGGILTVQDLIRASELNSLASDANKFKVAVGTFRLKYNALPGDMTNAQSYWGVNAGCATGAAGTGTQTCNGNGDNIIYPWGPGVGAMEQFLIWQHLSNAGLISGSYSGRSTTYYTCVLGTNCPGSKLPNVGFLFISGLTPCVVNSGSSTYWNVTRATACLMIGGVSSGWPGDNFLTPAEAASVDTKVDDGRPGLGNWRSFWGPNGYSLAIPCAVSAAGATLTDGTATTAAGAVYNVGYSSTGCAFQVDGLFN